MYETLEVAVGGFGVGCCRMPPKLRGQKRKRSDSYPQEKEYKWTDMGKVREMTVAAYGSGHTQDSNGSG